MSNKIHKIGLLGLGVIGTEIAKFIITNSNNNKFLTSQNVELSKILVKNIEKKRSFQVNRSILTTNPEDIISDPDISIIIEVLGGQDPAASLIKQALIKKKHVITANKEVVAHHWAEILKLAQDNKVNLLFEASVGAGIPAIGIINNELAANHINSIDGILNGTTNYILSAMNNQKISFLKALKQAQDLGYAEPDPHNDISGKDSLYKINILANLAFNGNIPLNKIYIEGIENLNNKDFQYAKELGFNIKLIANAKRIESNPSMLQISVYPKLIPHNNILSNVNDVYNAILFKGNPVGNILVHGKGAGPESTTSAIAGNLLHILQKINTHQPPDRLNIQKQSIKIQSISKLETKYYLRLQVTDRPGVLAQLATILGNNKISISSVIQKDSNSKNKTAELVILTHTAIEQNIQNAIKKLKNIDSIRKINSIIRVADLE